MFFIREVAPMKQTKTSHLEKHILKEADVLLLMLADKSEAVKQEQKNQNIKTFVQRTSFPASPCT